MRSSIPDTLRTLYVFTDGCRGQNHNHTMVDYLQTLVLSDRFDKVVHRLPVLPCDSDIGVIEKFPRKKEVVELHSGREDMLRERSDVTSMTCSNLRITFQHSSRSLLPKTEIIKFLVTKFKVLSFSAEHKCDIEVSQTTSDTATNMFGLLKPGVTQVPDPVRPLYIAQLAIKEAKVKDVKALSQYRSPVAQQFIALLMAKNERDGNTRWESDYDN